MDNRGFLVALASFFPFVSCLDSFAVCFWMPYRGSSIPISSSSSLPLPHWPIPQAFSAYLEPLRNTEWVVYSKPPTGGPQQVLEYLSRYTHRVAFANHRLVSINDGQVKFRWKDYCQHNRAKVMTLSAEEFIRRFLLHVLPTGMQRIRHYGFLGNCHRAEKLTRCRQLLGQPPRLTSHPPLRLDYRLRYELLTGRSLLVCPHCHHGQMVRVERLLPLRTEGTNIQRDTS